MEEAKLLQKLRRRKERALEQAVGQYAAYVAAVIRNRAGGALSAEDIEELVSDVFLALWQRPDSVGEGRLRPWLARVANNKTVDVLRRLRRTVPLEENTLVLSGEAYAALQKSEELLLLRAAMQSLSKTDQEIFRRYYRLEQSTDTIANELQMNASTVRTRLKRGRELLRRTLEQEGFEP